MDEHNGYFRIATTTNNWRETPVNNLYIMDGGMKTAFFQSEFRKSLREEWKMAFEELQRQGHPASVVDTAAENRDDATVNEEIQAAEDARREAAREITSRQGKGRLSLAGAKRQVHEAELAEEGRLCAQCGETRQKIGEETVRRIEYIPGHFVHHEHRLSKYACANCRDGVLTAPGPQRILQLEPG